MQPNVTAADRVRRSTTQNSSFSPRNSTNNKACQTAFRKKKEKSQNNARRARRKPTDRQRRHGKRKDKTDPFHASKFDFMEHFKNRNRSQTPLQSLVPLGHKPDGKGQAVDGDPFNEHDFLQHVVSLSSAFGLPLFSRA